MTSPASPARNGRNAVNAQQPHGWLIERECSESGEVVPIATVFLTNRECPWRCVYCDLWKNTLTETLPPGAIPAQIDHALARLESDEARQIKLYNAGSFFDPKAIPPGDFPAIAERVGRFDRVIVECHPALVGASALGFRDRLLAIGDRRWPIGDSQGTAKLEVAMGLEIADDALLAKLNKRMTLTMFRRASDFLANHAVDVRAFVMVKPPFVRTEEEALDFARRSIDFAFDCGAAVVSLIPARFGTEQLEALAKTGDFAPPRLDTLEAALDYGIGLRRGRVFADLWDVEKLGGCCRCLPDRVARLREMNLTQAVLPRPTCTHDEAPCITHG